MSLSVCPHCGLTNPGPEHRANVPMLCAERPELVHLPAILSDLFHVSRSEARRRIALGRVKLNGQVVTDVDVDLNKLRGDDVQVEMESHYPADGIVAILRANQEAIERG